MLEARRPHQVQIHIEEGRSWMGTAYVTLDVHKEMFAVAVAWPGRAEPEYRGILPNRSSSLMRLIRSLQGPQGGSIRECARRLSQAASAGRTQHRMVVTRRQVREGA